MAIVVDGRGGIGDGDGVTRGTVSRGSLGLYSLPFTTLLYEKVHIRIINEVPSKRKVEAKCSYQGGFFSLSERGSHSRKMGTVHNMDSLRKNYSRYFWKGS